MSYDSYEYMDKRPVLWIRIILGPGSGSASNKNQDPDSRPDSHQSNKMDPDPHKFSDDKPKCVEYEPIWALFQGFEPLFGKS